MKNDLALIKACLEGNELACKELYQRYISYCYGICIRYFIAKEDIKDVIQIIFSETFRNLHQFDVRKSKFKTWFSRISINQILNWKKKEMRRLQYTSIEYIEEYTTDNIEANPFHDFDKEQILLLINQMPTKYQLVFNLFVIDGFSHKEISEKLEISIASSRVILSRSRDWIKSHLLKSKVV